MAIIPYSRGWRGKSKPPFGAQLKLSHPLNQGILACWTFNEGGGTIINDASPSQATGTLTAFTPGTDWVAGERGPALQFDGAGAATKSVSVSGTRFPSLGNVFSFWGRFRVDTDTALNSVIFGQGATASAVHIRAPDKPTGEIQLYTPGTVVTRSNTSTLVAGTKWYEFVISRHGTAAGATQIYINGVLQTLQTDVSFTFVDTATTKYIGQQGNATNFYCGAISDLRIWNRPLAYDEVQLLKAHPYDVYQSPSGIVYFPPITTTRTQTGVAHLAATTTKTQIGVARVTVTTTRTQTGVAKLNITTTRTQSGVSRVTATTTRTQTGVASISGAVTTTKTQSGVARVSLTTTRTQSAVSRVTATTTRTQLGIGSVKATTTRTQTGKGAVKVTVTKTQTGISNIAIVTQPYTNIKLIARKTASPGTSNSWVAEVTLDNTIRIHGTKHTGTLEVDALLETTFLTNNTAVFALDVGFMQPFPTSPGNDTNVMGLFVTDGSIISGFETQPGPQADQSYAIVDNAPAINIDPNNVASIVTRLTNTTINESVTLWNAFSGSAQIMANGADTVPTYTGHGTGLTTNGTYNNGNSWYNLTVSRAVLGINAAGDKLYLCAMDGGLTVPQFIANVLIPAGITHAINCDGGGSTSLVWMNPTTHVAEFVNASTSRAVGSSIAIGISGIKTQTGTSRIKVTNTKTQTGVANITGNTTTTKTQTGVARVKVTTTRTQAGVARIGLQTTKTQAGVGRVTATATKTQLGLSRITITTTRTQAGIGNVKASVSRTQAGVAKVTATTTRTQLGTGRVGTQTLRTQTGLSRVKVSTVRTQTGTANVGTHVIKNQVGLASVKNTLTKTQTGVARLSFSTFRTQTGMSAVKKSATRTQLAITRIEQVVGQTITGKTKVLVPGVSIESIDGRSSIKVSTSQTQTGKAYLFFRRTRVMIGYSFLNTQAVHNQTGVAHINRRPVVAITGKANLHNTTTKILHGTAKVERHDRVRRLFVV